MYSSLDHCNGVFIFQFLDIITGQCFPDTESVALALDDGTCIIRTDQTDGITVTCRGGSIVVLEQSFIDGLGEVVGVIRVGCVCPPPGVPL